MYSEISRQDKIILPELRFMARHGVLPQEQEQEQEFRVSLELVLDLTEAAESDELADTLDYGEVYRAVERLMLGPSHRLLESLASEIAYTLLANDLVQSCRVRLEKTAAPLSSRVLAPAAVELVRTVADYGFGQ